MLRWRTTVALAAVTAAGVPAGVAAFGGAVTWQGVGALVPLLVGLVPAARRWPVAALVTAWSAVVAYRTAGLVGAGWVWPVSALVVPVVLAGRAGWAVAVGAVGLGFAAAWEGAVAGRSAEWVAVHVGGEALWLAAVLAVAVAVRDRRRWRAEVLERAGAEAARRRAEERVHIAREVHDVVAHTVAVVGVHLNVALDSVRSDPAEAEAALRLAQQTRGAAMADLRSLVGVLRDGGAPVEGLAGLDDLVRRCGLPVTLTESGERGAVPAAVGRAVYRIVQEALTNCVRHAAASRADVVVDYGARAVTVTVTDDGRGGPVGDGGHGLAGMQERVTALGGTLSAGPAAAGFAVVASMPTGV